MNTTLCAAVPAPGAVVGTSQAKLPATEAVPPVKVALARVWPSVRLAAVGQAVTDGVAWFTVTLAVPVAVV